eukprot:365236-Chlamydomonas_euryale.AAC.3
MRVWEQGEQRGCGNRVSNEGVGTGVSKVAGSSKPLGAGEGAARAGRERVGESGTRSTEGEGEASGLERRKGAG